MTMVWGKVVPFLSVIEDYNFCTFKMKVLFNLFIYCIQELIFLFILNCQGFFFFLIIKLMENRVYLRESHTIMVLEQRFVETLLSCLHGEES